MNGRRSVIGLAMVCALVLSAFAATSAFAGGKLVLCAENAGAKNFGVNDKHCTTNIGAGNGVRGHEPVNAGVVLAMIFSNANTASGTTAAEPAKLKGKISGITTEVQCTTLSGEGEMSNSKTETFASGTAAIEFSGCTVTLPAGRGCSVGSGGVIKTNPLAVTTAGLTNSNEIKIEPGSGETEFASVPIEGCKENAPPAANYPVTGSLVTTMVGATMTPTHALITALGSFFFGGNVAGIQGAATVKVFGSLAPVGLT
jgi:hypothetical protein